MESKVKYVEIEELSSQESDDVTACDEKGNTLPQGPPWKLDNKVQQSNPMIQNAVYPFILFDQINDFRGKFVTIVGKVVNTGKKFNHNQKQKIAVTLRQETDVTFENTSRDQIIVHKCKFGEKIVQGDILFIKVRILKRIHLIL